MFSNQAEKLAGLMQFLEGEIKNSRIIMFFSTCSSVNFHYPALSHLFKLSDKLKCDLFKLHGKIDQKKR